MRRRTAQSFAAEATFRQRLAELGAELLEPVWLGSRKPHRARCPAGHACSPRPDDVKRGQGVCRVCAGNDPAAAEAAFRARLAERGATLLEPQWLGNHAKHHVRCAVGHDCYPQPSHVQRGQGFCRICARRDPATAEAAFRARLAELGATLLEPYKGALEPHHVRCVNGHACGPRPADLAKGHGICRVCSGYDSATAEAAFRSALVAAGSTLLEPYRGSKYGHEVRCAAGHEGRLRPDVVARGHGVCRDCAYRTWDVFYVLQHESEPRVKFGITNLSGKVRLRAHRKFGYTNVLRLETGLPGRLARDTEDAVRAALGAAGERPAKGREYFDVSCLGLILDVVDSWLSGQGARAA